jgi:hypothetical protein
MALPARQKEQMRWVASLGYSRNLGIQRPFKLQSRGKTPLTRIFGKINERVKQWQISVF